MCDICQKIKPSIINILVISSYSLLFKNWSKDKVGVDDIGWLELTGDVWYFELANSIEEWEFISEEV